MSTSALLALLLCVGLCTACASNPSKPAASLRPASCGSTPNVHAFGDVLTAGQPAKDDFAQAKKDGIKTVINYRQPAEQPDLNEKALVESLGMTYVSLPWQGEGQLNDQVFTEGRRLLRDAQRPVMVHCATANRVGAIWLVYRTLDQGISYDDALAEARQIGLKTPAFETKAQAYISKIKG